MYHIVVFVFTVFCAKNLAKKDFFRKYIIQTFVVFTHASDSRGNKATSVCVYVCLSAW